MEEWKNFNRKVPVHTIKPYGNGGIAPLIRNLVTRWRCLVSRPGRFTPRKELPYAMNRSLFGCDGEEKRILPFLRIEARLVCRPARSLVTISTELCWLYTSSSLWQICSPSGLVVHLKQSCSFSKWLLPTAGATARKRLFFWLLTSSR
jgi:hypothetical protein